MGVCIAPRFEKKFRGSDSFSKLTEGKCLVYCLDRLNYICRQHGLPTLSSFAPDDDEEIWFDSADGLKMVTELLKILKLEKQWFKSLAATQEGCKARCGMSGSA